MKIPLPKVKEKIHHLLGKKTYAKWPGYMCLIFLLLTAQQLIAQPSNGISGTVNSGSSDYEITIDFNYNDDYCNCRQTTNLSVASSGSSIAVESGFMANKKIYHYPGSGKTITYNYTFRYTGRRSWSGDGCSGLATCLGDGVSCNCDYTFTGGFGSGSTVAIKAPRNVQASDEAYDSHVLVTWEKGSDIPNEKLYYKIYRNNVLIATVPATEGLSYRDETASPGQTYTYVVTSFTDAFASGNHESPKTATGVSDPGSTFTLETTAADGTDYNRVKITWNDISSKGTENIRVERSKPGLSNQYEELAILNKNATSYSDIEAIAGYTYTYKVTPLATGKTFISSSNTGYRKPNGVIRGEVKSTYGASVPDVTITITSTFSEAGTNVTKTYSGTTDASGYYEIKDIYYFKEAEYTLTPSKGDHEFDPVNIKRKLDENIYVVNAVNFTDKTVYTIAGTVKDPKGCPVKGVKMLLDGTDIGKLTDAKGEYLISVENEGTYNVKPVFLHHSFNVVSKDVAVITGKNTADFVDTQKEELLISLLSGCGDKVANTFNINIRTLEASAPYCWDTTFTVTGTTKTIQLPAQKYSLQVAQTNPINDNLTKQLAEAGRIVVDLTKRDSVDYTPPANGGKQPKTTKIAVAPKAQFVYHEGISVVIKELPREMCAVKVVMEKDFLYPVTIEIKEINTFTGSSCFVSEGTLKITDDVNDKGKVTLPIENGNIIYPIKAGNPNIVSPFTKGFEVTAEVGFALPKTERINVIVTGGKPRTGTFVTKTPELPC